MEGKSGRENMGRIDGEGMQEGPEQSTLYVKQSYLEVSLTVPEESQLRLSSNLHAHTNKHTSTHTNKI